MISEPDRARLSLASKSAPSKPKISDGELDEIPDESMSTHVEAMAEEQGEWQFVVSTSSRRTKSWWLRGFMAYFREGITVLKMEDGRLAFCTWSCSR